MSKNVKIRLLVVLGVLGAAVYFAFPLERRINLGLDLKGGMHLILRVETEKIKDDNARSDAVVRAIEILRNRIDGLGVAEPVIQRQGEDQIIVQLPGVTDRDSAVNMVGRVAQLNFVLVSDDGDLYQQARNGNVPKGYEFKKVKGKEDTFVLLEDKPVITGDTIENAMVDLNTSRFGEPEIILNFNAKGARTFAEVTRAHVNERLAIVLDGEVFSAPNINEPILNGRGRITGNFSFEESSLLALALRSGSLPAPMHIEEERTIGPLLGRDSIKAGVKAALMGGAAVLIFMLFYYLKAGLISDIALMMNLMLIMGIMGLLNALMPESQVTLTLPGIAGIILTMGMAVDANVLINERMREEILNGRPIHAAVANGFSKAFKAILDSNLTTLIAAFMLFQFGSGPIKGFAVTLSIGLMSSLFTSLFVTRTIFMFLLDRNWLKTLPMLSFFHETKFDFVAKKYLFISVSVILIAVGMTSFVKKGDSAYGIDFAGGQIQEYRFQKPVVTHDLRNILSGTGLTDLVIQRFEQSPENVMIRSSQDTYDQVAQTFKAQMPDNPFEILRIEKVGPIVGKVLRQRAMKAMLFALAGILIYVGFRFRHFDFATAGVIALLHDVVITLGFVALFGRQVDLLVITALLTIAGYSINDTIIIYDRVRENTARLKKTSLKDVLNLSINQTLGRTILTTLTTLLVVISLYLFGGEVLNNFAFCLLVGFIAGTYSTIFIATPLVLAFQKKAR